MRINGAKVQPLEQKGKLPGVEFHNLIRLVGPMKPVFFQPLLPQAETVAVPVEDFDQSAPAIAKHEQMTGKGIAP